MSEQEVDSRRKQNWIRDPANYPDHPPSRVRSGMRWSYVGIAHLNNWCRFFAGIRENPPGKSGLFRLELPDGSLYFGPTEDE